MLGAGAGDEAAGVEAAGEATGTAWVGAEEAVTD